MSSQQQSKKLCLSFWNISLLNFPSGKFEKRELSGKEAKQLIDTSVKSGTLLCVSADDLNAPYNTQEKEKHDNLRNALLKVHDIDLQFIQFNSEDNGGDESCYYITPLEIVCIDEGCSLLVVTCSYTMDAQSKDDDGFPVFTVAPDTIEFHLFES